MKPRVRPDSADEKITYDAAHKQQIISWLHVNMMDSCELTRYGHSAVDDQGYFRWRLALNPGDNRILFDRASDAQIFRLTWT